MLQTMTLNDFLSLAKQHQRVVVYREILADKLTPIGIAEALGNKLNDGAILESGIQHTEAGRYSFIAFGSMAALQVRNHEVTVRIGEQTKTSSQPPFTALRELISTLDCYAMYPHMDFVNGAVGFLTYDAVRLFEMIPDQHCETDPLPEMQFHFYETTLMFDHVKQTLLISFMVETGANPEQAFAQAQTNIDAVIANIARSPMKTQDDAIPTAPLEPMVSVSENDTTFIAMVEKAKDYIAKGDAFQIVLSRTFTKQYSVSPFDIYRILRRVNPAPYMFYLPTQQGIIVGASPEKLISVRQGEVSINPIAGTRARHVQDDTTIERSLLADSKERAEHMMLVDLARNDLGVVCEPGSIRIDELMKVKHYSHVSHINSIVKGQLRTGKDAFDALAAAFPAGTLSGAPKIRAMAIIDALESSRRGMYGGAICRIDYQGSLDSCIAIRIAVLKDGVAKVRAGAGIVFDSDPTAEANETKIKANAMLTTLQLAEETLA